MEKVFVQCLAIIENANRRMLSVIIERGYSDAFFLNIP